MIIVDGPEMIPYSLCKKLVDVVNTAMGKWFEPFHIRRMAKARAYEIETIGNALREYSDIPVVYDAGKIRLDTKDFDEFIKRTNQRLVYQELVKQSNLESVIDKAYKMLERENSVTDDPVDQDWILRFFNSVQDVSSEEMQTLWAKILAGEVKRPSTYSIRTLETLRNINKDEALLFQRICNYVINDGRATYLPNYPTLLRKAVIPYDDVMRLGECGLLLSTQGIVVINKLSPVVANPIAVNRSYIILATSESLHELNILAYPLTSAGREISKLFESDIDDEFFIAFAREIKDTHSMAKVCLHKIIDSNGSNVNYDVTDLLEDA